jgi:hypothetical protein
MLIVLHWVSALPEVLQAHEVHVMQHSNLAGTNSCSTKMPGLHHTWLQQLASTALLDVLQAHEVHIMP